MTNKIQKIREGIEKLKSNLIHGACSSQVAMETRCKEEAYNEVLAILESMQEEPVSEDLEEAADNALSNVLNTHEIVNVRSCLEMFKYGAKWHREKDSIVSDDLEEAAEEYSGKSSHPLNNAFKAGAKWQKTQDESTTEDLEEYINELSKQFPEVSFAKLSRIAVRVAKWQKKQMMAEAIDVEVKVDAGDYPYISQMELYDYDKDVPLAKAGEKVKVIVIKED